MNDEIVQYFIINKEIKLSKGKLAAQVGHVAVRVALDKQNDEMFKDWMTTHDEKKIVLEGKEKDLLKLIDQGFYFVRDNGLNEVPAGTLTCVGLPPMYKEDAKKYIKRLQVCKDRDNC
jgi:peptidyl-tRNA hydrolase